MRVSIYTLCLVLSFGVMVGCGDATVSFQGNGDGSFEGSGGDKIKSQTWENSSSKAEYEFEINAESKSSATLILKDADGNEVLNKTLNGGNDGTNTSGVSSSGAAGEWTIKLELNNFDGTGSFSVDPN